MVAIFQYYGGLHFTGYLAESEEQAWKFLDEKYGFTFKGENFGCNHNAFCLINAEMIGEVED